MWRVTDADILASVQPSHSYDEEAGDEEEEEESDRPEPSTKEAREAIDECLFLNKGGLSESRH